MTSRIGSWYHPWVAALRIARRDAWRAKGRSALVLSMIALPIVGVSAADLTFRSSELSTEQQLTRQIGAADARFSDTGLNGPILQRPDGKHYAPVGGYDKYRPDKEKEQPLKAALPVSARVVEDSKGHAKVHTTHGLLGTDLRELDVHDPLTRGLITLDRGRLPSGPGEVIATNAFLKASGLHVGSAATPRGASDPYRIVGAYELPSFLKNTELLALPGTLFAPLDRDMRAAGGAGISASPSYLVAVSGSGGFTWNMVKEANTKGALVLSRAVTLRPPADSDVPLYKEQPQQEFDPADEGGKVTEKAVLATVVGLAMLEICLLAGPAFAVGARRSRRQLGLVGANGGDRRHIRAIVLSGGLVIGAVAAVAGTAIGVALTIGLRPVLEDQLGVRFGGFAVRPLELLGIALLAVLTGLLAAIAPAITSSRQTVLASLTGRRGIRRANRVLPVLGLLAVVSGAAIALYGTNYRVSPTVVAGGSAIAELGVVALTPVLVGLFGRLGRWLPLSPRLALRDAVRNRGRTAPAVAAVLAAAAGTVAVSTYQYSRDVQARHEYTAELLQRRLPGQPGQHEQEGAPGPARGPLEGPAGERTGRRGPALGRKAELRPGQQGSGLRTHRVDHPEGAALPALRGPARSRLLLPGGGQEAARGPALRGPGFRRPVRDGRRRREAAVRAGGHRPRLRVRPQGRSGRLLRPAQGEGRQGHPARHHR